MPLYRRRESVTAYEIIDNLRCRSRDAPNPSDRNRVEMAITLVEAAMSDICSKNGIENENVR